MCTLSASYAIIECACANWLATQLRSWPHPSKPYAVVRSYLDAFVHYLPLRLRLDLGTSLRHLRVLRAARCGLTELDGIGALPLLEELYLAFNDIWDLSSLAMHENIQVSPRPRLRLRLRVRRVRLSNEISECREP